jgi:hypothetical protein
MAKTMSDVQSEISFGQIAASNSLNRSPLGVNKYLMEKKFHALRMEAIVFYMV